MANKYLKTGSNGFPAEQEALVTSGGAGDAGKIVALSTDGKLHTTVLPSGVGPNTVSATAGENLTSGNLVYLYNDTGTLKARKADANADYQADGFVLDGVSSGQPATVYMSGTITGLVGKTIGAMQYLSETAGEMTETVPTASGDLVQPIGKATSTSAVDFRPAYPIKLA